MHFALLFLSVCWRHLHTASQKKLRETLESHHLKKEDLINSIHKDKDKMNVIKVLLSTDPKEQQHRWEKALALTLMGIYSVPLCIFSAACSCGDRLPFDI